MNSSRLLTVISVAALLAGCAVPSPYVARSPAPQPGQGPSVPSTVQTQPGTPPESSPPAQSLPPPVSTSRPRTLSPASRALVAQAQTQLSSGNDALAAATIERALRIEPDNPLLWTELAKIRMQSNNAAQAENLARKALSMATGDNKAQAAAWRVIAESYRARGRNPEARDADAKADTLD